VGVKKLIIVVAIFISSMGVYAEGVSAYVETMLTDKYILFTEPTVVSDNPQVQSLVSIDIPHGFGICVWNSTDLEDSTGDEIDYNIWWGETWNKVSFSIGYGVWDIDPVLEGIDDIRTAHIKIGYDNWYIKPRYYESTPWGDGINISVGFSETYQVLKNTSILFSPFVAYNDGYGTADNFNIGVNIRVTQALTKDIDLFLENRFIDQFSGAGGEYSSNATGIGLGVKF
jgi:hypothetical protein